MKVIPETRRAHYIWYLRFITDIVFASFDDSLYDYRIVRQCDIFLFMLLSLATSLVCV
jgi:hypothetical protein